MSKKYNRDLRNNIVFINHSFIYSGINILNLKTDKNILIWRILNIKNNMIHLEGKDNCFLKRKNFFYFCKIENKTFYPKYYDYCDYDLKTIYGNKNKGRIVKFDIPLENRNFQNIQFFLSYNHCEEEIFTSISGFSRISNLLDGYYNSGEYIFKLIENRFIIYKYNESLAELFEKKYCDQLKNLDKNEIIKYRKDYIKYRNNNIKKKQVWIINDKRNIAGDNGEYFFRYLKKINEKRIEFYFAIKKNSTDYRRLKGLGDILELGTEQYFNIFLKADKIISSVSEDWVDNPFGKDTYYIKDLFHFEYIFIKHGIIKDDLSKYLNKFRKNFNLIITSSYKEYNSFLNPKYGYNKNNIILTGLPRYDNLKDHQTLFKKEKIITILPTWRMYIKGTFDYNIDKSIYSRLFNLTTFFNFYNDLINDKLLILKLKKLNYSGILCLHPFFSKQAKDFKHNEIISIFEECDYENLVLKSSLLITDYSSIFFDFAYLNKPVIYAHFDYEEYRKNHYPQGYFSYKKHGFGPVCYNIKCIVNTTISIIKNNCALEKLYQKRNTYMSVKEN